MAFNSVLRSRHIEIRNNEQLSAPEMQHVYNFLYNNCPGFIIPREEVKILFKSFVYKRFYKKKKKKSEQLSLYA